MRVNRQGVRRGSGTISECIPQPCTGSDPVRAGQAMLARPGGPDNPPLRTHCTLLGPRPFVCLNTFWNWTSSSLANKLQLDQLVKASKAAPLLLK